MFGYISINKPELKVKEYETYKAVYCGLCRNLGKEYGVLAKFILNYDLTFVSLLQMAVKPTVPQYERSRCRANPFKKCSYCKNDANDQSLASAACVALFDLKVEDNIADNPFIKGVFYRILRLFSKNWAKKAYKKIPALKPIIDDYRQGQRDAENTANCSIDMASEPTAKAVSRILALIECDAKYGFVLQRMGYCLGKWIYLCDAVDDLPDDIKTGNFNVLKQFVTENFNAKQQIEGKIVPILNNCWTECAKYSELLEIEKYHSIIENILYEGLKLRQSKIFKEEKHK